MTARTLPCPRLLLACALAGLGTAATALPGADAATLTMTASLEGTRVVEQYRDDQRPASAQNAVFSMGLQREAPASSGVYLLVSLAPPEPWILRLATLASASARLDSGDALRDQGGPRGKWFDQFDVPLSNMNGAAVWTGIQFSAPAKPAREIGSLEASLLAIIADSSRVRTIMLKPKAKGKIHLRGLSGEPDGDDMVIWEEELWGTHALAVDFRGSRLPRLKQLRILDDHGAELQMNSTSTRNSDLGKDRSVLIYDFRMPIGSVAVDTYDSLRAGAVDLIYTDLPLAGVIDPALRDRDAHWHETALPAILSAPIEVMPPQEAAPTADPAASGHDGAKAP